MEDGLALVDDFPEGLVKLAGVDVFAAVLEIAEESTSFSEGDAGAFRRSKLLLNPFSFTPESGVVFSGPVVLIEAPPRFESVCYDYLRSCRIPWGKSCHG